MALYLGPFPDLFEPIKCLTDQLDEAIQRLPINDRRTEFASHTLKPRAYYDSQYSTLIQDFS